MTRVDFYVLEHADAAGHGRMLCRVVEKAWQRGHTVFVACEDSAGAAEFDELLWRFNDISFVPHAVDEPAPVRIGVDAAAVADADVLVNLSAAVPAVASRFHRVIESAGYDGDSRAAARLRYRHYQERGYPLHTHKVGR